MCVICVDKSAYGTARPWQNAFAAHYERAADATTSTRNELIHPRGAKFLDPALRGPVGAVMTSERVECVVIGAGVVGLAVAHSLALAGREVIVLEATE
jgi:NADPH-dependent 2,4-dienoyl-CoA reductase/sulfur reductase-like enzyme